MNNNSGNYPVLDLGGRITFVSNFISTGIMLKKLSRFYLFPVYNVLIQ